MNKDAKILLYAALGGVTVSVIAGVAARKTTWLAVSSGEDESEAVARLLTRSGSAALLAGIGLTYFASPEWKPIAIGAVGAGAMLAVSGATMSKTSEPLSLPPQIGTTKT